MPHAQFKPVPASSVPSNLTVLASYVAGDEHVSVWISAKREVYQRIADLTNGVRWHQLEMLRDPEPVVQFHIARAA